MAETGGADVAPQPQQPQLKHTGCFLVGYAASTRIRDEREASAALKTFMLKHDRDS